MSGKCHSLTQLFLELILFGQCFDEKKGHIVIIPTLTNIVHVLKRIRNAYYEEYLAPAS